MSRVSRVDSSRYLQVLYALAQRFPHVSYTPRQTHVEGRVLVEKHRRF